MTKTNKEIYNEIKEQLEKEPNSSNMVTYVASEFENKPNKSTYDSVNVLGVVTNKVVAVHVIDKLVSICTLTDGINEIEFTLPIDEAQKILVGDLVQADIVRHIDLTASTKNKPVKSDGVVEKQRRVPLTISPMSNLNNSSETNSTSYVVYIEGLYKIKNIGEDFKINVIKNIL